MEKKLKKNKILIKNRFFFFNNKKHRLKKNCFFFSNTRNIPFFLHWRPGCRHIPYICSLNIPNNSLYNASYFMCTYCVERLLHIGSHFSLRKWWRRPHFLQNWWRWPHFPTKLAEAALFSYKIGGGGKDLATLLAAVLTWSGYWTPLSYFPEYLDDNTLNREKIDST